MRSKLVIVLAVTLGLSACGHTVYGVDGHVFHSAEDAHAYVRAKSEELVAGVQPLPTPIAGPVIVLTPTRTQLEGTARIDFPFMDDREIQSLVALMADNPLSRAIERRNIFESVQHIEADSPEGTQVPPHGYLIWCEWRKVAKHRGADVHIVAAGEAKRTKIMDGAVILDPRQAAPRLLQDIENYVRAHPATG